MNWVSVPTHSGMWLRMTLDDGVMKDVEIYAINPAGPGVLYVGNRYTPSGGRYPHTGPAPELTEQPDCLWAFMPTDSRGRFQPS